MFLPVGISLATRRWYSSIFLIRPEDLHNTVWLKAIRQEHLCTKKNAKLYFHIASLHPGTAPRHCTQAKTRALQTLEIHWKLDGNFPILINNVIVVIIASFSYDWEVLTVRFVPYRVVRAVPCGSCRTVRFVPYRVVRAVPCGSCRTGRYCAMIVRYPSILIGWEMISRAVIGWIDCLRFRTVTVTPCRRFPTHMKTTLVEDRLYRGHEHVPAAMTGGRNTEIILHEKEFNFLGERYSFILPPCHGFWHVIKQTLYWLWMLRFRHTWVSIGNLIALIRVQPDFLFTTLQQTGCQPFLKSQSTEIE